MIIAKRVRQISASPTLAITAKANQMKAEGMDIIGFGAGEPDFDTPFHIKKAAQEAMERGFTKYTPTSGIKELKEAICAKLKTDNNLAYSSSEILVSCGAKHSIFNTILCLCNEGDEVILPAPYWVSYMEMIKFAGAYPMIINTDETTSYKITTHQLQQVITPRTKLLILNYPSNPTGMIYSEKELVEIGEILVKNKIFCLSDEIYEKLIYDGEKHLSIASLGRELKSLTLLINGVSKCYAMTGWRIGYAAGPQDIIQAMSNLQDHSTSNPCSIAQWAAVEALKGKQEDLFTMVGEFKKRRDYMVEKINSLPNLKTLKPQGAFYCWVDISALLEKNLDIANSLKLTERLLSEARVAVVPGSVFGDDKYIRLSYATSLENISEGLKRMEIFVKEINK